MALSDKIQDILAARTKIKTKLYENKIHDEMTRDEIAKIAPVFQEPVVEQLQQTFFPPLPEFPGTDIQGSDIRPIEAPRAKKRKIVDLDPDQGINATMLEMFKFNSPSQFLNLYDEPQRSNEIEGTVQRINGLLKSYGGKKSKGSLNFDPVINHLRHYKESIKSLQKIPHFQAPGISGRGGGREGTGSICGDSGAETAQWCQRLELLIASRLAGNDNQNIVNEAKTILNLLLKDSLITQSDYSMILRNYLSK